MCTLVSLLFQAKQIESHRAEIAELHAVVVKLTESVSALTKVRSAVPACSLRWLLAPSPFVYSRDGMRL